MSTNLGQRRASHPLCAPRSQTLGRDLQISYLKEKIGTLVSVFWGHFFLPTSHSVEEKFAEYLNVLSLRFYLSTLSLECTCPPPWVVLCCELWQAWWGHSWTLSWSCAGPAGSHWEPVWSTVCVHSAHSLKEQEGDKQRERDYSQTDDKTTITAGSRQ